jgi:trigger factor
MTEIKNSAPYEALTITKLPDSELEIRASIPASVMDRHRSAAVKHLGEHASIDGFRKGHIPENILIQHVGDMAVLEETAEHAIGEAYPAIVIDNALDVIGRPHISITKLAAGNPVEFVAKTAIIPTFELPDYRKVAEKARKPFEGKVQTVTDKEVDAAILDIRKRMAHFEKYHANGATEAHDEHEGTDIPENELPALDDAFVQKLGEFKTVAEFRELITKNIASDKEQKEKEKKRLAIVEALVAGTTIPLPSILREAELDKMMGEFRSEIERMGVAPDEYFSHLEKTPEMIREEWRPEAEKRAKLQLILNAIANKENVLLPEDKVDRDIAHVLEHYKDANPDSIRMYVESMMRNEKVFELLEGTAEEKKDAETKTS